MKKLIALLAMLALLLAACGNEKTTSEIEVMNESQTASGSTEGEAEESEEEGGVNVDKGLFSVEVTLPASFFEGEDVAETVANAEKNGFGEATVNDDGSVTYKMSKNKHKEMMAELATSVEETKTELVESGDFPSIKSVETNKDYTSFTINVDRAAYENSFDAFATMSVGVVGSYYQAFNGVKAENMEVLIEVKDVDTGEVINSVVYPEALENMGEE